MATKRQVVSTAEAAEILGVSPSTVRRMHARGVLNGFLGKSLGRITVASIEKLLGEPIRWPEDGEPKTYPVNGIDYGGAIAGFATLCPVEGHGLHQAGEPCPPCSESPAPEETPDPPGDTP